MTGPGSRNPKYSGKGGRNNGQARGGGRNNGGLGGGPPRKESGCRMLAVALATVVMSGVAGFVAGVVVLVAALA